MPIIRAAGRNILFVHIPKCGGSTVERTLRKAGVALSFIDQRFGLHEADPWYRSSPQHILRSDLETLFAPGFFDAEVALVRDPVARFLSAFNHHRRSIGKLTSFSRFLGQLEARVKTYDDYFGYRYDNHFVPAARFLDEGTEVLRLEEGMQNAINRIGAILGVALGEAVSENQGSYEFTHSDDPLKRAVKKTLASDSPRPEELSAEDRARIEALYGEDYATFGY